MNTFFENRVGDALALGAQLKREGIVVDAVVSSPPYFRVREYGEKEVDRSEIGRETDDDLYIRHVADALAGLPVRDTGSIWVNIGDVRRRPGNGALRRLPDRLAAAMEERGWFVADRVCWIKGSVDEGGDHWGNCMPESIRWRLNDNGREDLFRFVRSKKAWVDLSAVGALRADHDPAAVTPYLPPHLMRTATDIEGRRRMDTWRIQVSKSPVPHYAMFPAALVEVPVAMSCPMWICQRCGHARRRITQAVEIEGARVEMRTLGKYRNAEDRDASAVGFRRPTRNRPGTGYRPTMPVTEGWTDCGHDNYAGGIVLDPFAGTGTTGEVALKLGRSYIGNDLYADAASFAETRLREVAAWMEENSIDPWELALNPQPLGRLSLSRKMHSIRWDRRCGGERDDFLTPRDLARSLIDRVPVVPGQTWCDPFRGGGAFYDQYPDAVRKIWCEIKDGRDFFESSERADWLVSNPPYSRIDEVLAHSARLARVGVAYLIAVHALTPRRIRQMEAAGFGLESIDLTKIHKWFGMHAFVVFRRGAKSIVGVDRTVWREDSSRRDPPRRPDSDLASTYSQVYPDQE